MLEISRRIEREAGSTYRINGREVRARDVQLLFADAATGARSPALVRQGQISEIINAKPEQRRRILEDAAGIAGLHSRRHEAELRLKAAEANLARLDDVIGQLDGQIESLKRQARQAPRYKNISAEIRTCRGAAAAPALDRARRAQVDGRGGAICATPRRARRRRREARSQAAHAPRRSRAEAHASRCARRKRGAAAVLQRLRIEQDELEERGGARRRARARAARRAEQLDATSRARQQLIGEAARRS